MGKIFENLGKNVQNILKKDSLVRAIIVHMKQLEYALVSHARHA